MRRTIRINKVRLTDVKEALFKEFIRGLERVRLVRSYRFSRGCSPPPHRRRHCFSKSSSPPSKRGTSSPGRTASPAPERHTRAERESLWCTVARMPRFNAMDRPSAAAAESRLCPWPASRSPEPPASPASSPEPPEHPSSPGEQDYMFSRWYTCISVQMFVLL